MTLKFTINHKADSILVSDMDMYDTGVNASVNWVDIFQRQRSSVNGQSMSAIHVDQMTSCGDANWFSA